jgi:hypothetical protein
MPLYINQRYEQIGHRLGLFHGDLLHRLDITNPIAEGINDLDVLDVRDSVPGIAKNILHSLGDFHHAYV